MKSARSVTPVNAAVGAANRLFAIPFFVGQNSQLKTLSFDIGTGNALAWNARMCVYADNGSGLPGSLVPNGDTDTVAIAAGSVTGVQTANVNSTSGVLLAGPALYWVTFMADNAGESLFSFNTATGYFLTQTYLGATEVASLFTGAQTTGVYMSQTFGACPSTFSSSPTYSLNSPTPYLVLGF